MARSLVQFLNGKIMYDIPLTNWSELSIYFSKVFNGLGSISLDDNSLKFTSNPPDVKTELIIHRSGQLIANMPLHNVDTFVNLVRIDEKMEVIELIGPNMEYKYRIPPQLLLRR
jgi:hypothetical protein